MRYTEKTQEVQSHQKDLIPTLSWVLFIEIVHLRNPALLMGYHLTILDRTVIN